VQAGSWAGSSLRAHGKAKQRARASTSVHAHAHARHAAEALPNYLYYSSSTMLRPPRDVPCPPRRAAGPTRLHSVSLPEPRLQPYRMRELQTRELPLAHAAILLHLASVATLRVPAALSHAFQPPQHIWPPPPVAGLHNNCASCRFGGRGSNGQERSCAQLAPQMQEPELRKRYI
jgi:hypothetical protein